MNIRYGQLLAHLSPSDPLRDETTIIPLVPKDWSDTELPISILADIFMSGRPTNTQLRDRLRAIFSISLPTPSELNTILRDIRLKVLIDLLEIIAQFYQPRVWAPLLSSRFTHRFALPVELFENPAILSEISVRLTLYRRGFTEDILTHQPKYLIEALDYILFNSQMGFPLPEAFALLRVPVKRLTTLALQEWPKLNPIGLSEAFSLFPYMSPLDIDSIVATWPPDALGKFVLHAPPDYFRPCSTQLKAKLLGQLPPYARNEILSQLSHKCPL